MLLLSILLCGGCANLRVTTDVYAGGNLITQPTTERTAEIATIVQQALAGYEQRVIDTVADHYAKRIADLKTRYPEVFVDSVPAYVDAFRAAGKEKIESVGASADAARDLAEHLGAPSRRGTTQFKTAGSRRDGLAQLAMLLDDVERGSHQALRRLLALETEGYREIIQRRFSSDRHDSDLRRLTGMTVNSTATRMAAVQKLLDEIPDIDVQREQTRIQAVMRPIETAGNVIPEVLKIPLEDPNVPTLLSAGKDDWKPYVNHVQSRNILGNAEIAFRMDGLGDSHIKGILFDPSRVLKAGFGVFQKALEVTATAYAGASFPKSGDPQTNLANPGGNGQPKIDAEIETLERKTALRGDRMEALFWRVAAISQSLPADNAQTAADAARNLLALVECAGTELTDPTTKCEGAQ